MFIPVQKFISSNKLSVNILKEKKQIQYTNQFTFTTTKQEQNHYQILELRPSCSQNDVKQNFLRLAKIYHPDVYKGPDKNRFQQLQFAYEILKSPEKRRQYDKTIKSGNTFTQQNDDDNQEEYVYNKHSKKMYEFGHDYSKIDIENQDFQKQRQEFMNQKSEYTPDMVNVLDDPLLRQFNTEDRQRHEFVNIRNNEEMIFFKYAHQEGYMKSAQENVEILNNIDPPEVAKYKMDKRILKMENWVRWAVFITMVVATPFVISFAKRKAQIQKHILEDTDKLIKILDHDDVQQVQERFEFQKKKIE